MPHKEDSSITIKELHPTFAAEVHGVNFQDLTDEQFDEIYKAITKVSSTVPYSAREETKKCSTVLWPLGTPA